MAKKSTSRKSKAKKTASAAQGARRAGKSKTVSPSKNKRRSSRSKIEDRDEDQHYG